MTVDEINEIIDWCRKKQIEEKANPFGSRGKALDGYRTAMLQVMSYLHREKERLNENKVVVFPVLPRDTIYTISRGKIKEWIVYYVGMNTLGHIMFNYHDKELQNSRMACDEDIGEIVFLTEEDAINELKERQAYDPT